MLVEPTAPVVIVGSLASDRRAHELAAETCRLLHSYARDIVDAFRLRSASTDRDTGTHAICVVLDHERDAELAAQAVQVMHRKVVHVVFPLTHATPSEFERHGDAIAARLRGAAPRLVHATFHPDMSGGTEYAGRVIEILRRSPDPFVQVLPEGIEEDGSSAFGTMIAAAAYLEAAFHRVRGPSLDAVISLQAELRSERRRRYAPFVDRFGPFAW